MKRQPTPAPTPAKDPQTTSPHLTAAAEGDLSDIEQALKRELTREQRMSPAFIQHDRQPQTELTPIEDTRIKIAPQIVPPSKRRAA